MVHVDPRDRNVTTVCVAATRPQRDPMRSVCLQVIDLFLLARADVLVVSPMSTFGGFAHAYAAQGAPPWRATVHGQCVRAATAEPFFHHWPDLAREIEGWDGRTRSSSPAPTSTRQCWMSGPCALPPDFFRSEEARSIGLWLIGREASPEAIRALFAGRI